MTKPKRKVYLDYASLTPIDKRVLEIMRKFEGIEYGNPSSIYTSGVRAKMALEDARTKVADIIHAHPDEIIFTASGTEANNLVLKGLEGKHIIVSAIEHSSIIETVKALEKKGTRISYIPMDKDGVVDLEILKKEINKETVLISIMMVNNEIGTIEPIQEIAKIIRDFRKKTGKSFPLFHSDACQALYLPTYVEKLGVDMLTLDGHKIYGPRGVGMLYIKRGIKLTPMIHGGGQEKGLRSGTENISGIQGFAMALELVEKMREKESKRLNGLKNFFVKNLKNISVNGDMRKTSPHIINISIPNIDNEFFLFKLDARGIECSTKSACLRDEDESYVLNSIGANSKTSLRFSFGRNTRKKDIEYLLKIIDESL